jgi:hypothetical protein
MCLYALQDRVRHGCRTRAYMDVFTAGPAKHTGIAATRQVEDHAQTSRPGSASWPSWTRRKYIHVGSAAASMPQTVQEGQLALPWLREVLYAIKLALYSPRPVHPGLQAESVYRGRRCI